MLTIEADGAAGLIELTVDGVVNRADFEAATAAIDKLLESRDKLNVVEVVRKIGWIEFGVWWRDAVFHLTHRHWLHRVAVVSDSGWIGPLTRFLAPLYPAEIPTFALDGLDEARKWARIGNVTHAVA